MGQLGSRTSATRKAASAGAELGQLPGDQPVGAGSPPARRRSRPTNSSDDQLAAMPWRTSSSTRAPDFGVREQPKPGKRGLAPPRRRLWVLDGGSGIRRGRARAVVEDPRDALRAWRRRTRAERTSTSTPAAPWCRTRTCAHPPERGCAGANPADARCWPGRCRPVVSEGVSVHVPHRVS